MRRLRTPAGAGAARAPSANRKRCGPALASDGNAYVICLRWASAGAGGDNGIDHNQNGPRFPYVSTCWRSLYLACIAAPRATLTVATARRVQRRSKAFSRCGQTGLVLQVRHHRGCMLH
jgi:hypothetical protein